MNSPKLTSPNRTSALRTNDLRTSPPANPRVKKSQMLAKPNFGGGPPKVCTSMHKMHNANRHFMIPSHFRQTTCVEPRAQEKTCCICIIPTAKYPPARYFFPNCLPHLVPRFMLQSCAPRPPRQSYLLVFMRKRLLHQFTRLLATLAGRLFSRRPIGSEKQRRPRTNRAARCRFERLESREVFNATYHGGALLPHVEAQAVYLGSDWNTNTTEIAQKAQLDSYLSYLVQSPYMDLLTDHAYNVGQGTASPGKTLPVTLNKTNAANGGVSDATIQTNLQSAITSKILEQPDQNRLYVVFVEQGVVVHVAADTSATTFLGYHSAFAGLDASNVPFDIHYAVVSYPSATTATGFNPTSASQGFVAADEF